MQALLMARRRRNPKGSRGLRPKILSFVVSGHPGQLPPHSLSSARKTRLRGLREFFSNLLTSSRKARAAAGRVEPRSRVL